MTKYNRPFSTDQRKPVFIDTSDPRYNDLEKYRSRLGRDLITVSLPEKVELDAASNVRDFWFSSFADANLTGVNISVLNKKDNAIVLSRGSGTYTKGVISQYSKNKELISSKTFDLASSSLSVSPSGFVKGSGNNLFSFGNLSTATQSGYFALHSLDGSSTTFAKKIYDSTPYSLSVNAGTMDDSGNYYVAGTHINASFDASLYATTQCGFIAKISSDGSTISWQKVIGDTSFRAEDVSVFGVHYYSGTIYVLCALDYPTAGRRKIYAMVFDSATGTLISRNILNGFDYTEYCHSSAMDANGNIYITERVGGSFNPTLYKFNSSLTGQWAKQMSRTTTLQGTRVYADYDQNVYMISEQFTSNATSYDSPHLYKFDSTGNNVYNRRFISDGLQIDRMRFENGMAFDSELNPYIGGWAGYSSTSQFPILAHLPEDGSLLGTYSYGVASTSKTLSINYSSFTPTITSGTPSFSSTDYLAAVDDDLVIDTISFNISTPSYTESGVLIS